MNKTEKVVMTADFVTRLADKGYTKKDSAVILHDVLEVIYDALRAGEEVRLVGSGSFDSIETKPKKIMNIQTGKQETVAPHKKVKFKPGLTLKRAAEGYSD